MTATTDQNPNLLSDDDRLRMQAALAADELERKKIADAKEAAIKEKVIAFVSSDAFKTVEAELAKLREAIDSPTSRFFAHVGAVEMGFNGLKSAAAAE